MVTRLVPEISSLDAFCDGGGGGGGGAAGIGDSRSLITLNVQEHASSGGEDGEARVQFGVSDFFSPIKTVGFLPFLLIFCTICKFSAISVDFLSFL